MNSIDFQTLSNEIIDNSVDDERLEEIFSSKSKKKRTNENSSSITLAKSSDDWKRCLTEQRQFKRLSSTSVKQHE